ncbi:MAG: NAD(P)-dependent oxidoreductase [Thermoanaerobaculia bacterium]|nr:NAD(P)-dependent oxidoreductase [Thermoanaerobaculia bacterium]
MSEASDSPTSILITGASGFIGRHVLHRLLDRGFVQVHATSRSDTSRPDLPTAESLTWHRVDLADAAAVEQLVERVRPEIVLHLASHVAGSRDVTLVQPTFSGNAASTVHLLTALQEQRARAKAEPSSPSGGVRRFVQVGSLEEPEPGDGAPPSSPYAAAKAAATAYGRMFHHLYGFPIAFARVFMVYGPGTQDENKLVPYTFRRLLEDDTPAFGSGTRPVDWIFVEDVAEGLVRMGFADESIDGERIDLGSGDLHTVREVIEGMFQIAAPDRAPSFGGRADRQDEQVRSADVAATERCLGWRPGVGLTDGLRRTADWFRKN